MRRLHLITGLVAVLAFLASGQYMAHWHNQLHDLDGTTRMLFRSTHIYLLFSGLLNLALGLYLVPETNGWRYALQRLGSTFLLLTPWLFAVGFFIEPWLAGFERPYSRPGLYLSLAGMVAHLIVRARPRKA